MPVNVSVDAWSIKILVVTSSYGQRSSVLYVCSTKLQVDPHQIVDVGVDEYLPPRYGMERLIAIREAGSLNAYQQRTGVPIVSLG